MKKKLPIKQVPKPGARGKKKIGGGGANAASVEAGPIKPAERVLSADEFVSRLRLTYVHFCSLISPSVACLSRVSGVPYETLRHFLSDETHLLCLVNEEKLARALGHTSEYYRMLVRIWSREESWEIHLRAAVAAWLVQAMTWLQGRDLVLMEW